MSKNTILCFINLPLFLSILYFNEWGMRIKIYYKKINKKDLTNHLEYCILILHAKIGSEKSLYLMDGQDPGV